MSFDDNLSKSNNVLKGGAKTGLLLSFGQVEVM